MRTRYVPGLSMGAKNEPVESVKYFVRHGRAFRDHHRAYHKLAVTESTEGELIGARGANRQPVLAGVVGLDGRERCALQCGSPEGHHHATKTASSNAINNRTAQYDRLLRPR